jgi:UDP-N-acetylmuramate dehydrogenase
LKYGDISPIFSMPLKVDLGASLKKLNTMAVPAQAKALCVASSEQEILEALSYAKHQKLPILILGDGSNTVFLSDYNGLIILNRVKGIRVLREDRDSIVVSVSAGENWHEFVQTCVSNCWFGLENLALIPGLVGAAPIQNIGAYGAELKDYLVSVSIIDLDSAKPATLDREQCQFAYRDSAFKRQLANKTVITSVTLKLSKTPSVNLSYPALADALKTAPSPTPKDVFDAVCNLRREKLPLPSEIPNSGSFFKNPIVDAQRYLQLKFEHPTMPAFSTAGKYKLPAAWLIEQAGWKDRTIDGVCVHQRQALVVINPHGVSGAAIYKFATAIQSDIAEKFAVNLEIEPQLI